MKYFNTVTLLNRVIFGITLVLYLTVIFGLYAQIVLGAYQVLIAVTLLFFMRRISIKNQKLLAIYWFLVISYGLLWLFDCFRNLNGLWVITFIVIPLGIAGYFTFILESLKTKKLCS